ncbi:MAG: protein kinase [Candidatus Riflebacteria bacterium]|nr:protein kinase [Candidatus Riflebacteria bacterium]
MDEPLLSEAFRNRYRIEGLLGHGAMGQIYVATQLALRRRVALKLMRAEVLTDEESRGRFVNEARLLAGLSHPNIVSLFDASLEGNAPYLAMELIDGPTLGQTIAAEGRLGLERSGSVARGVLAGLAYLHDSRVLHRDLKPENILLPEPTVPKLADFGLAKAIGSRKLTADGFVVGTTMYMAPELFDGQDQTVASDLYAFGMVLFRMLTASYPVEACGYGLDAVIAKKFLDRDRILAKLGEVPEALAAVVARCLDAQAAQRYESAAHVLGALSSAERPRARRAPVPRVLPAIRAAGPVPGERDREDASVRASAPRPRLLLGLILTAAAFAGALTVVWLRQPGAPPVTQQGAVGPVAGAVGREPEAGRTASGSQPSVTSGSQEMPRVEVFAGVSSLRLTWAPAWPRTAGVRYDAHGVPEKVVSVVAHATAVELGQLRPATCYQVRPVWPPRGQGPTLTVNTLERFGGAALLRRRTPRSGTDMNWASDGNTLYFLFHVDQGRPLGIRVSRDSGLTFSPEGRLAAGAAGRSYHLLREGRDLWLAYDEALSGGKTIAVLRSADGGRHWSRVAALSNPAFSVAGMLRETDGVALFFKRDESIACYRIPTDRPGAAAIHELDGFGHGNWLGAQAARTSDGTLHLVGRFAPSASEPGPFFYARTRLQDGAWERPVPFPIGGAVAVAPRVAAAGRSLYVLWADRRASGPPLRLARSHDSGRHWEPPTVLPSTLSVLEDSRDESLALVADGKLVAVAWHDPELELATKLVVRCSTDRGAHFEHVDEVSLGLQPTVIASRLMFTPSALVYAFWCPGDDAHALARFLPRMRFVPAGDGSSSLVR